MKEHCLKMIASFKEVIVLGAIINEETQIDMLLDSL